MKLKSIILILLLMVAGLQATWAQGFRVYKSDGTVAQFSLRTDSIVFYDGIGSDVDFGPFTPVNQMIVGTWYKSKSETVTFNADGTTDYIDGATYEFLPYQGIIIFYNASNAPTNILKVYKVTAEKMIVGSLDGSGISVWNSTRPVVTVSEIVLSETSLTLQIDETRTIAVTVLPEDADNPAVTWESSNNDVVEVDADGTVIANSIGTCIITCRATDESGVYSDCYVTVTDVQLVTSITLSQTTLSLTLPNNKFNKLTATIQPNDATNKNITWSSSNTDIAIVNQTGKVTAKAKGSCTVIAAAADSSGVKAECQVTVCSDKSGIIDGREYVDLDLPSGTLWATCNIGASSPEEFGNYYAWGETTTKNDYSWSTYKYCKGSYVTMEKYCVDSSYGYNGFTDGVTELLPMDDAATANWGSEWQMPSLNQFQELIDSNYTTTEWITLNGKQGRKITSRSNGKSIFLPGAGYYDNTLRYGVGGYGYFWSRTLHTKYSYLAYNISFSTGNIVTNFYDRYLGRSIRPVRKQ